MVNSSWVPFKQVTIAGVGLLGGSLGLAIRERGLAEKVVGLGRSPEKLRAAFERGCMDAFETDCAAALREAELTVLCQPVKTIVEFLPECFSRIPAGGIVTDVGSTKESIVAAGESCAERRGQATAFVGSHPMAGSERGGAQWSDGKLFIGATCHVAITPQTPVAAAARVAEFWRRVGARIILDAPARHDRMAAAVSHVPHLTAAALVESLSAVQGHPDFQKMLLGPGFRDMTRIAMGGPDLWTEICQENRAAIFAHFRELLRILHSWNEMVETENWEALRARLENMAARRKDLCPAQPRETSGGDFNG